MNSAPIVATRDRIEQVEEGLGLAPQFDGDGLIPRITADAARESRPWRRQPTNHRPSHQY